MDAEKKVCPQCGSENYNPVPTKGEGFIAAYQCEDCNIVHMIITKELYASWRSGKPDPRITHTNVARQSKPL